MATTGAMIDAAISIAEEMDPLDFDSTDHEVKLLHYLQEIFDEVWNYRTWPFSMRLATVTIPAASSSADLPADFQEVSHLGGVYLSGTGAVLSWVPPQVLLEQREAGSGSTDTPDVFSIWDQSLTTGRQKIQVPTSGSGYSLRLYYKAKSPTLVNATDGTNNLFFIPDSYHQSVLFSGLVWRLRKDKGDERGWEEMYKEGLARMCRIERPGKSEVQRMPRAYIGGW